MKKPTIVMQSDFGIDSGLVACMHGMCRLVDSELETGYYSFNSSF